MGPPSEPPNWLLWKGACGCPTGLKKFRASSALLRKYSIAVPWSGTNQLHGTAIEYFRNSALDARNFFNPVGQPQAPFHNNQFGGSLGGPIVKDKTFFFADYEGRS